MGLAQHLALLFERWLSTFEDRKGIVADVEHNLQARLQLRLAIQGDLPARTIAAHETRYMCECCQLTVWLMLRADQKGCCISEAAASTDYFEKLDLALSKTDHTLGMWGGYIGLPLWVMVVRYPLVVIKDTRTGPCLLCGNGRVLRWSGTIAKYHM